MKKLLAYLFPALMMLALAACGDDGYTYSNFHCNLTIHNETHQDATLAGAMNVAAPGIFCTISSRTWGGATFFVFSNNQQTPSEKRFNAIDMQLESQKHLGRNNGIIVGFGSMPDMTTGAPTFYAYDLMCPNCFNANALPLKSYPLAVNGQGIASCAKCKRQYDLNQGGIISAGDKGEMLKPYRASTTGPLGILHVY